MGINDAMAYERLHEQAMEGQYCKEIVWELLLLLTTEEERREAIPLGKKRRLLLQKIKQLQEKNNARS